MFEKLNTSIFFTLDHMSSGVWLYWLFPSSNQHGNPLILQWHNLVFYCNILLAWFTFLSRNNEDPFLSCHIGMFTSYGFLPKSSINICPSYWLCIFSFPNSTINKTRFLVLLMSLFHMLWWPNFMFLVPWTCGDLYIYSIYLMRIVFSLLSTPLYIFLGIVNPDNFHV